MNKQNLNYDIVSLKQNYGESSKDDRREKVIELLLNQLNNKKRDAFNYLHTTTLVYC